ncbi:nucleotidyl transferase AbiEii/AbiGii toxin family protein [Streptomyces sp. NPDC018031]|uniref:nucleotidyl transferase AbiEii/AbiGii toxin family protein n=1 Tax=Streptomyces sp. NPDC018031 TaxID=3365033 RepID=UPI0037A13474
MNLSDLHRRLLADVLAIGTPYPLVITGGYAVQAHGLVDRLSQDLDVATENPAPMADITRDLEHGLTERGWHVAVISVDPLSARLVATDPRTGEECEVDVLKENLWSPPALTEHGPVLALDDVVGTKVRALADRGAVRDLIDVHAAADHHSITDLERLGERHGRDEFRLADLRDRLTGADWYDDEEFAAYGLTPETISLLRTWAQQWAHSLDQRLAAAGGDDEGW